MVFRAYHRAATKLGLTALVIIDEQEQLAAALRVDGWHICRPPLPGQDHLEILSAGPYTTLEDALQSINH